MLRRKKLIGFDFKLTLCIFIIINLTIYYVSCIYPFSAAPTIYIAAGYQTQGGYVQDVNGDGLADIVLSYYQRDYGFASLAIFMNNGCNFVRHLDPATPVEYCPYYFEQLRRLKWEADPPVVNLIIPLLNTTKVIELPYFEFDLPSLLHNVFGIDITPPIEFYRNGTRIDYNAIRTGNTIQLLSANATRTPVIITP
ncbi:hypothetical protein ABK040_005754 [Willaertia magna]